MSYFSVKRENEEMDKHDNPSPSIRMKIPIAGLLAGFRSQSEKKEDAETQAILLAEQTVNKEGLLRLHLFSSTSPEGALRIHRCSHCGATNTEICRLTGGPDVRLCQLCLKGDVESGFFFVDRVEDDEVDLTEKGRAYLNEKESRNGSSTTG